MVLFHGLIYAIFFSNLWQLCNTNSHYSSGTILITKKTQQELFIKALSIAVFLRKPNLACEHGDRHRVMTRMHQRVCELGTKSCRYNPYDPACPLPQNLREIFHVCVGESDLRNA